jgi:hypothetical protein
MQHRFRKGDLCHHHARQPVLARSRPAVRKRPVSPALSQRPAL